MSLTRPNRSLMRERRILQKLVVIKGGGDVGSAVAHVLFTDGYQPVIIESSHPATTRRNMSFATAVFEDTIEIEGVQAERVGTIDALTNVLQRRERIPVYTGPAGDVIRILAPTILVDCRMRKRDIPESQIDQAPLMIGLGPGFRAGETVHAVIETSRGPNLGKVITSGSAEPYTGKPITIHGYGRERYSYAPTSGIFRTTLDLGASVEVAMVLGRVGETEVQAQVSGIIRGITKDGIDVTQGTKIAEVDPRGREEFVSGIGERPRAIAQGVLEAVRQFAAEQSVGTE